MIYILLFRLFDTSLSIQIVELSEKVHKHYHNTFHHDLILRAEYERNTIRNFQLEFQINVFKQILNDLGNKF